MGFSRVVSRPAPLAAEALTAALVGIGMNLAAQGAKEPNIEDTLLFASFEGMEKDDLRVLAVLVTWFGVHSSWVNADRLTKLVDDSKAPRVRALWSALGHWHQHDRRFARLAKCYGGDPSTFCPRAPTFRSSGTARIRDLRAVISACLPTSYATGSTTSSRRRSSPNATPATAFG
jgi:hypothetical protein